MVEIVAAGARLSEGASSGARGGARHAGPQGAAAVHCWEAAMPMLVVETMNAQWV